MFSRRLRIGSRAAGCVATVLMAVVGCTTISDGAPTADTAMAPAYRTSVAQSISASSATSKARAAKRAGNNACISFAEGAKDATEKLENFIDVHNSGASDESAESSARDALNHSVDLLAGNIGDDMLSPDLRDSLNAYLDAARDVATKLVPDPEPSVLNDAIHGLRDAVDKAKRTCIRSSR